MRGRLRGLKAACRRVISVLPQIKQKAEVAFWRKEILRYLDWYNGTLPMLYKTPAPSEEEKIRVSNLYNTAVS